MSNNFRKLLFVFVLLFTGTEIFAQQVDSTHLEKFKGFKTPKFPSAQNVLKTNLIPIFIGQIPICGEIRITYERMIWHNQSISVGASYNFPSLFLVLMPKLINPMQATLSQYSLRGARIIFGYRYYPLSAEAPKGFFFGPYFSYNFVRLQERHGNGSYAVLHYVNASLVLGYQAKFGKHIFLEFFGGLGYKRNFETDYDSHTRQTSTNDIYNQKFPYFRNVKLALQMNVGYGW
jgi:hypothetical protein